MRGRLRQSSSAVSVLRRITVSQHAHRARIQTDMNLRALHGIPHIHDQCGWFSCLWASVSSKSLRHRRRSSSLVPSNQ